MRFIADVRFRHGWDDISKGFPCAGANIGLLRQTQNFRVPRRTTSSSLSRRDALRDFRARQL